MALNNEIFIGKVNLDNLIHLDIIYVICNMGYPLLDIVSVYDISDTKRRYIGSLHEYECKNNKLRFGSGEIAEIYGTVSETISGNELSSKAIPSTEMPEFKLTVCKLVRGYRININDYVFKDTVYRLYKLGG